MAEKAKKQNTVKKKASASASTKKTSRSAASKAKKTTAPKAVRKKAPVKKTPAVRQAQKVAEKEAASAFAPVAKMLGFVYHGIWLFFYKLRFLVCLGFSATLILSLVVWQFDEYSRDKSFWNVQLGGEEFDLNTEDEVRAKLEARFAEFSNEIVTFHEGDKKFDILISDLGLTFDIDTMTEQVMQQGRTGNKVLDFFEALSMLFGESYLPILYSLDERAMRAEILDTVPRVEEAIDAYIAVENGKYVIVDEQIGNGLDFSEVSNRMNVMAQSLKITPVYINSFDVLPEWFATDLQPVLDMISDISSRPLKISINEDPIKSIDFAESVDWFHFDYQKDGADKHVELTLNTEKLEGLATALAESVKGPENVTLKVDEEGNYKIEGLPKHGEELLVDNFVDRVYASITDKSYELVLEKVFRRAQVESELEDQEGILELLAVGKSDFSGSTTKRIHNVTTGLSKIDGVVLPKGYEFSFTEFLGPVNGDTGYEKELVIKSGGRTVPEYGGGLCQVSTTTYRAALNAGMPITERRNHSYSVSYYSPAGTDATIYPPYTDMKFVNETDGKMYVQTFVDVPKRQAFVYLYGTHDGREVEVRQVAAPYNHYEIEEPKLFAVDWLNPGERKLMDHGESKTGFETIWQRVTKMPDGEERTDKFYSHYRAFPAMYYIGKADVTHASE